MRVSVEVNATGEMVRLDSVVRLEEGRSQSRVDRLRSAGSDS